MTAATTTPATSRRVETRRKRSRVEHYWWISEGEAARSFGVGEVPAICGRAWVKLPTDQLVVRVRQTESGTLTDDGAVDACKICERMMLADARREFNKRRQGRP